VVTPIAVRRDPTSATAHQRLRVTSELSRPAPVALRRERSVAPDAAPRDDRRREPARPARRQSNPPPPRGVTGISVGGRRLPPSAAAAPRPGQEGRGGRARAAPTPGRLESRSARQRPPRGASDIRPGRRSGKTPDYFPRPRLGRTLSRAGREAAPDGRRGCLRPALSGQTGPHGAARPRRTAIDSTPGAADGGGPGRRGSTRTAGRAVTGARPVSGPPDRRPRGSRLQAAGEGGVGHRRRRGRGRAVRGDATTDRPA
jgi:hypothetical protein